MTLAWYAFPLERLLRERFGLQNFHSDQRMIIERLVKGKRVLAIQRTGWGKSLCYQVASMYIPGLTIVISPLKALMRDQCQRCNETYKIPAAIVSSDVSDLENRATLTDAVDGKLRILYIAPERFGNRAWQEYAPQMQIGMVVVDEAHCISVWGHDFRPDYRRIRDLLALLPESIPVLALTATANRRVEQDILEQIGRDALVVRGSMRRPNLYLGVIFVKDDQEKLSYLVANIPTWKGAGIIYTATKSSAEEVASFLLQQGIEAEYYHSGRANIVRQNVENGLMTNGYKVICSTNALGMGIDKPDVRFVIHYHFPASPIHYYQEIGRAGRDGQQARCILLYDPSDVSIQRHFTQQSKPASDAYERLLGFIRNNAQGLSGMELLRMSGFSEQTTGVILADLEEQRLIKRIHVGHGNHVYVSERLGRVDLSVYDRVRKEKERELADMQGYAQTNQCYMGYLTSYLGDAPGYRCGVCGNCRPEKFIPVQLPETMKKAMFALEQNFLPPIEKHGSIEAGYALSHHGTTKIGRMVRASKYENAGMFADELVSMAIKVARTRYPVTGIDGIVSVPSTRSGKLVEDFARRVATGLGIPYISGVVKKRATQEQKLFTNALQKQENVAGAFAVLAFAPVQEKTLLLIDDIYDSGYTLREVAATLQRAGARVVYPLTITRTLHSDDQ